MLLDLCLIFLNPYTVHVLLNSIVKRLHAHTVSTDSYPSTSSGGGTQDYDGLPLLSQKLEDDERLIDLCSLYLLGKREREFLSCKASHRFHIFQTKYIY